MYVKMYLTILTFIYIQEGNIHWKDWCWSWNSNTLATWWEELTRWKRPWFWKKLKAGGEGDDRGWDGWMASPTWWTWVWASSGSWWWTGKHDMLQSTESQRVGYNRATELNWRREWLPSPLFLPGELHEQSSLTGYSPWDYRIGYGQAISTFICIYMHVCMCIYVYIHLYICIYIKKLF